MPSPLSSPELAALRVKAARESLSPEEVAKFVAATRVSFLAQPKPKGKKEKEKPVEEKEIDFF